MTSLSAPATPDPARGLFETMLVAEGRTVRAAPHLERLAASAHEVFDGELPAELPAAVEEAARPLELGRMRIDLLPEDGGLRFEIRTEPIDPAIFFPDREHGADLRTIRRSDWAGAHKWADRDWLESVEADLGEVVPLILTDEDEVLEAGRANIFVVADGGIATPPVDGRILPGTGRAATLELAADLGVPAAERRLDEKDLRGADDLFLTSSVRGIRPVRSIDGEPLGAPDPLVERLAAELKRRWLDR
jgi:para-aminobenzoate synthetase / 4-amino-4-deoxychorismate lyase